MKNLFLIDIRWVFLLGVFYVIWSRPVEQPPAPVTSDATPELPISSSFSGKPISMAIATPAGNSSKFNPSFRGYQNAPWSSDPEDRKYADAQDDPNSDPMNGGSSLSQGAVPVNAAVGSTNLVVVDNVYGHYYYYGYGAWRYHDFGRFNGFGGVEGRRFGTHSGSSVSPTPSLSSARPYGNSAYSSTYSRGGSTVLGSPSFSHGLAPTFAHSHGVSLSPTPSFSHGSSLSGGSSLSPSSSTPRTISHGGSTYSGGTTVRRGHY